MNEDHVFQLAVKVILMSFYGRVRTVLGTIDMNLSLL